MKKKAFSQKLSLNKKTIANLGNGEMSKLNGGGLYTDDDWSCPYTLCCHCTGNPCKSIK